MSKYGQLREQYQVWLSLEGLPNRSPETLLQTNKATVTPAQQKELKHWVQEFAAIGDN